MDSLNVKNINDEKIFNVIDPNGQGNVETRIRPISISINQKAETINNQTDSTINLAVYWNDTWKSILDLSFDESLRQEYGKLVEDLTKIQKDIDMKQYKDAETKTADFLKYIANVSSKYTAIPEKAVVANTKNEFVSIKAEKNSVNATISDTLLNFMLRKFAKVKTLDYTKANECFSTNNLSCLANHYDLYYHSPEIFQKQAYMTVVKDNKVVGSYKVNYDQFCKFASKFAITPKKLGYSKDKMAGYMKTAEVVMQNIFFDNVDEAKEWQEMVDEKKKEIAQAPEGEEETTEIKETETKTEKTIGEEGKSESPVKEEGGLVRPDEGFASDEIPESQPRQQEQQGGGQGMAASRRLNNVKKVAEKQLWVEVIYGDGEKDKWIADMNPNLTDEEVKKYFIGKTFNLENKRNKAGDPLDELVKVKDVVIHRESGKSGKLKKKAGTGNFKTYSEYPLIAIGDDDVYPKYAFVEEWNEDNPDDKIGEWDEQDDTYYSRLNDNYEIVSEDMRRAIDSKDTPYHKIGIEGGYYEGLQLTVEEKDEDFYNDYDNDNWDEYSKYYDEGLDLPKEYIEKREQAWEQEKEKVAQIMKDLAKEQGWGEYPVAYHMSNGETGYSRVNASRKVKRLNKKALYGDVQEQDIVPAKTETKVYLQSEKEEQIKGIGDIVTIYPDIATEEEVAKYSEFIGKPMLLMETDKEDVNNVILEEMEYPFQRITVNGNLVGLYDTIKGEDVIVEDTDGDEIITSFVELPIVAKSCKIKAIRKAANISKKQAYKEEDYQLPFEMKLIVDGKEEYCEGIASIDMEISTDITGDGEHGDEYYVIDDYNVVWMYDLKVKSDPKRKFTPEEEDKIFKDNIERFEEYFPERYLSEKINEPAENPYE